MICQTTDHPRASTLHPFTVVHMSLEGSSKKLHSVPQLLPVLNYMKCGKNRPGFRSDGLTDITQEEIVQCCNCTVLNLQLYFSLTAEVSKLEPQNHGVWRWHKGQRLQPHTQNRQSLKLARKLFLKLLHGNCQWRWNLHLSRQLIQIWDNPERW